MTINKCLFAAGLGGILAINIFYHISNPAEYMVLGTINAALVSVTACLATTRQAAMVAMVLAFMVNYWAIEPVLQFTIPTIPEFLMFGANMALAVIVPYLKGKAIDTAGHVMPPIQIASVKNCGAPIRNQHRRIAIQLCAQLPDGITDSRLILLAMQEVVDNYLERDQAQNDASAPSNILPFSH